VLQTILYYKAYEVHPLFICLQTIASRHIAQKSVSMLMIHNSMYFSDATRLPMQPSDSVFA